MTFFLFSSAVVYNLFVFRPLISLLATLLLQAPFLAAAASPPTNVTIGFDSPQVSFSQGWQAAVFDGAPFAFADGLNDEVQVLLPRESQLLSSSPALQHAPSPDFASTSTSRGNLGPTGGGIYSMGAYSTTDVLGQRTLPRFSTKAFSSRAARCTLRAWTARRRATAARTPSPWTRTTRRRTGPSLR